MTYKAHTLKKAIIEKAQILFGHYGFHKTTMDEIAQAVHKGKSTLYHYFQNKEDIFKTVIEKEIVELKETINVAVSQETLPQDKLKTYILTRMRALKRLANLYQATRDDYLEHYGFFERFRANYDEYERVMISKILDEGVEHGYFAIEDTKLMAYVIVIATKGLEYPWMIEEDTEKIESNIETLFHTLLYGLLKRKRESRIG